MADGVAFEDEVDDGVAVDEEDLGVDGELLSSSSELGTNLETFSKREHNLTPATDSQSTAMLRSGVEIIMQSLSVSSLISIFGLRSVQKIFLNQYKLSILALFTFKFPNFQSLFY